MRTRVPKMIVHALWELPQNVLGAALLGLQAATGRIEAIEL